MAKIIPEGIVGSRVDSNSYGEFTVLLYIGKPQKEHMYKIKFTDTGNEYTVSRSSIMRRSCVDKKKKLATKKENAKKKIAYRKRLNTIKGREEIEFSGKNCRILSLDQSLNGTAFTYGIDNQMVKYGRIETIKSESYVEKIIHIRNTVSEMIDVGKIDVIAIEGIYFGGNVEVFKKLSALYTVLQILAFEKNVKFVSAVAYEWKKYTGCMYGKRNSQKKKSIQRVNEIYGLDINDDDISDSILIFKYVSENCINYISKNPEDFNGSWG